MHLIFLAVLVVDELGRELSLLAKFLHKYGSVNQSVRRTCYSKRRTAHDEDFLVKTTQLQGDGHVVHRRPAEASVGHRSVFRISRTLTLPFGGGRGCGRALGSACSFDRLRSLPLRGLRIRLPVKPLRMLGGPLDRPAHGLDWRFDRRFDDHRR